MSNIQGPDCAETSGEDGFIEAGESAPNIDDLFELFSGEVKERIQRLEAVAEEIRVLTLSNPLTWKLPREPEESLSTEEKDYRQSAVAGLTLEHFLQARVLRDLGVITAYHVHIVSSKFPQLTDILRERIIELFERQDEGNDLDEDLKIAKMAVSACYDETTSGIVIDQILEVLRQRREEDARKAERDKTTVETGESE